jgi:hypothetical protein
MIKWLLLLKLTVLPYENKALYFVISHDGTYSKRK